MHNRSKLGLKIVSSLCVVALAEHNRYHPSPSTIVGLLLKKLTAVTTSHHPSHFTTPEVFLTVIQKSDVKDMEIIGLLHILMNLLKLLSSSTSSWSSLISHLKIQIQVVACISVFLATLDSPFLPQLQQVTL
ncbi:uncharacterized protein [Rutidosis leptorrhynchoides]|uniref:uncharacterized protein isoform X2 n=1 Tax=Rutidosis leptorrhynchoides TaxID=125765 RepID=UPI003A9A3895